MQLLCVGLLFRHSFEIRLRLTEYLAIMGSRYIVIVVIVVFFLVISDTNHHKQTFCRMNVFLYFPRKGGGMFNDTTIKQRDRVRAVAHNVQKI